MCGELYIMVKYENDCVSCDLRCTGHFCPYINMAHYYCDDCGEETQLYEYDGSQLCADCILRELPKVN